MIFTKLLKKIFRNELDENDKSCNEIPERVIFFHIFVR